MDISGYKKAKEELFNFSNQNRVESLDSLE